MLESMNESVIESAIESVIDRGGRYRTGKSLAGTSLAVLSEVIYT